jgi:hypothetical protein
MAHLSLSVFHVRSGHLQPGCMRTPENLPVDPADPHHRSSGFDVTHQNVVVPHRPAFEDRLKYEIIRIRRLDDRKPTYRAAGPDFDLNLFQSMNPFKDFPVYRDSGVARLTFRRRPIAAATALIHCDGGFMDVTPFQADQFTDPEALFSVRYQSLKPGPGKTGPVTLAPDTVGRGLSYQTSG